MPKEIVLKNGAGRAERIDMARYIREKLLDIMEEKPFYSIKVRELVEHAGISRSTFYLHYDSIYSVVQQMEDEFLEQYYPYEASLITMWQHDLGEVFVQSDIVIEHKRELRALLGPFGDPYFSIKLGRALKTQCRKVFETRVPRVSPATLEYRMGYIVGGVTALLRETVNAERDLTERELEELTHAVFGSNDIMLGFAEPARDVRR